MARCVARRGPEVLTPITTITSPTNSRCVPMPPDTPGRLTAWGGCSVPVVASILWRLRRTFDRLPFLPQSWRLASGPWSLGQRGRCRQDAMVGCEEGARIVSNINEGATVRDPVAKLDAGIGPRDGARFSVALRGYDRIEVDECLARIAGVISSLQAAARGSRRPERPTPSPEQRKPPVPIAPQQDSRPEVPGQLSSDDGFGARLEKIMVLARQEAAEIRAGATAEARQLVEQSRAA